MDVDSVLSPQALPGTDAPRDDVPPPGETGRPHRSAPPYPVRWW
ncbi:hypothetical protein [Streptomyces sp. NPDC090021]